jgi:hypothetical protein
MASAGAAASPQASQTTFPLLAGQSVSMMFFTGIKPELASKLQAFVATGTWKVALLNSSLVCHEKSGAGLQPHTTSLLCLQVVDPFQVCCACAPAVIDQSRDKLKSKNLMEEIIFNLSATTHVRTLPICKPVALAPSDLTYVQVPSGLKKHGFSGGSDAKTLLVAVLNADAKQVCPPSLLR